MRTRLRVTGLVVSLASVLAGLALGNALGAQTGPRLTVVPASGRAGQAVVVRGYGFRPRASGFVVFGGRRVASFRAGARGGFRVGLVVPAGAHGRLRIIASRSVRTQRGSWRRLGLAGTRFQVLAPRTGGGAGGLTPRGAVPGSVAPGPAAGAGGATGGSTGAGSGAGGSTAGGTTGAPSGGSTSGGATGGGSTGGGSTGGGSTGGGSTGGGSTGGGSTGGGSTGGGSTGAKWAPPEHLTWYWQLQGTVNNSEPVAAYDIDGFDNTSIEVAALHAKSIHVICYIDVGTYEPGRPDTSSFPAGAIGAEVQGWPGERWLDVRQLSVLEPIMAKRFEMCKEKGFDAVEPDNMDGYENSPGFPITAAQQATYDEWVATEAHSLGMAVLQKNDGGQTSELEPYFDGALTEECNVYGECSSFASYLTAGKPVLNAEYGSSNAFCAADNAAGIMGARFDLELAGKTFEPCW
jgi:hypothetical protein